MAFVVLDCYGKSNYSDAPCIDVLKAFDTCSETRGVSLPSFLIL
jgi:hypothetical protein